MISLPPILGLTGCGLVPASLVLSASQVRRFSRLTRGGLLLGLVVAAFLPISGLPLAGYVRGLTGDFSVTTLILLAAACLSRVMDRELCSVRSKAVLMFLVLSGGILLYPMTLGLTTIDPYILGFGSRAFIVVLFVLALWAVRRELYLINLCLSLSVLAYTAETFESRNLWDYLIDPWIVAYAAGFSGWWWWTRRRRMSPTATP